MDTMDVKNITQEIDSLFSQIKNELILKENIQSKDAEEQANEQLFYLLEDALDKYTLDLANAQKDRTYIVSQKSLDMFAKTMMNDLRDFDELWTN